MRAGKIIMIVAGGLLILFGLGMSIAAAGVSAASNHQAKSGFFTLPREIYAVDSHAITLPDVEVGMGVRAEDSVGTVLVRGESAGSSGELFIGVGLSRDVERYLQDVSYSELRDVRFSPFDVSYREYQGASEPPPPAAQDFWAAQTSGTGEQQLNWNLQTGDWTVVVMNADGAAPVAADLQAGFRADWLGPVAGGLWIGAVCLVCAGVALLVGGIILLRRTPPGPVYAPGSGAPYPGPYANPAGPGYGQPGGPYYGYGGRPGTPYPPGYAAPNPPSNPPQAPQANRPTDGPPPSSSGPPVSS